MQAKAVDVVCPSCGWVQKFRPQDEWHKVKDNHRTECKRCGRSFKVTDQVKEKISNHRKKEDDSDVPFGFHKYSKKKDD